MLLGSRVVVADEPTTGQDGLTKRRVVGQLAALTARGIAVVLLSHDLDVVRALADEVVVLREGRVVESGPAERLWEAPRHPWTRELLASEGGPTSFDVGVTRSRRPVVRVRGLVARHRAGSRSGPVVLRVPALDLHAGECLAVVGRSGSGKTTLARCLAGLHRDHDGDVLLDDTGLPRVCVSATVPNWRPCSTCSRTRTPRSTSIGRSCGRWPAPPYVCGEPTRRRPGGRR